jgi:hypothetical protein
MAKARYTEEEVRTALRVYASVNGRADLVKKMLAAEGLDMKPSTVRDWATRRHRDLYLDVRQGVQAFVRAHDADRYRSVVSLAHDVMEESLRQSMEALKRGELKPEQLPGIAQKAAISAGVSTDKSQVLDGEPDSIVRTPSDVGDITRELAASGIHLIVAGVDRTAPDAIDVQVKQPEPVALPVAQVDDDGKDDGKSAGS